MQLRNIALTTLLTSGTAMSAFAEDTIQTSPGIEAEDAAEVSGQYIYDRDTYRVEGQTYTNVGGEIRSESTATREDGETGSMSTATQTSGENVVAVADQGTPVSTSDNILIGNVAYTQEMSNGYRVFVSLEDGHNIGADMIGFSAEVLEVKSVGEGLEYGATLEDLRMHVADKTD